MEPDRNINSFQPNMCNEKSYSTGPKLDLKEERIGEENLRQNASQFREIKAAAKDANAIF